MDVIDDAAFGAATVFLGIALAVAGWALARQRRRDEREEWLSLRLARAASKRYASNRNQLPDMGEVTELLTADNRFNGGT